MHPILLYDGVCGLCNRLVQFILKRDRASVFRFASLQSNLAADILARHGTKPDDLDTVYVVVNHNEPEEFLWTRSDAVLFILQRLGGIWGIATCVLSLIPRSLRDWAYRMVASHRYRIFGRYDACPMPTEETHDRFLDI